MNAFQSILAVLAISLGAAAAPPVTNVQLRKGDHGPAPYVVSGSVPSGLAKAEGAGLVFGLRDAANYSLVWVESDSIALWKQVGGEWERLAAERLEPRTEPMRVEALCDADGARVLVDGRLVLSGAAPGEGKAGGACSRAGSLPEDVSVAPAPPPWFVDDFQDPKGEFPAWTPLSGQWRKDAIQDPWLKLDKHPPKASRYRGSGDGASISVTGRPVWHGYAAQVAAQFVSLRDAGLVFGFRDEENYAYLRLGEEGAVLGTVEGGRDRVVARKAMDVRPGVWHTLRAECLPGRARAYVGRVLVGDARIGAAMGKAGLEVTAGGDAIFDKLSVEPAAAATPPESRYATLFKTDFSKASVPGEETNRLLRLVGDILLPERGSAWRFDNRRLVLAGTPEAPRSGRLWYRDSVRGDAAIEATARLAGEGAVLALAIADGGEGGYALRLEPGRAELRRNGQALAERRGIDLSAPTAVRLRRRGNTILASVGGADLAAEDTAPIEGGRVGVWGEGAVELSYLEIGNGLAATYRFEDVEPDWRPSAGEWIEHNGMTCIEWDHWIGAKGTPDALLWHAFAWPEHFTARVWVSESTDGTEHRTHVHHPYHSVQFIVSGDGQSMDKGYRFSIAEGPGKNTTRLYRDGKTVAETKQFQIVMGGHSNRPRTFLATVRRDGATLTLWINDKKAIEYTDPDPLGAGQIAVGCRGCRADFKDFTGFVDKPWLSDGLPAVW